MSAASGSLAETKNVSEAAVRVSSSTEPVKHVVGNGPKGMDACARVAGQENASGEIIRRVVG